MSGRRLSAVAGLFVMAGIANVPKLAAEGRYPVSVSTISGTWEADIKTRINGVIDTGTHEVLTLSADARDTFSYNGHFLFTCAGKWWLTLTSHPRGGLAEIHIRGVITATGRRCFKNITIKSFSRRTMTAEFVGLELWPYPVGRLVAYRRMEGRQ